MQLVSIISPFFSCNDFPGLSWLWLLRGCGEWEMHSEKMPHEAGVLARSWLQSLLHRAWWRRKADTSKSYFIPISHEWGLERLCHPQERREIAGLPSVSSQGRPIHRKVSFQLDSRLPRITFEHQFLIVSWLSTQSGYLSFRTLLRLGRTQLEMGKGEDDSFGSSQYNPNTS